MIRSGFIILATLLGFTALKAQKIEGKIIDAKTKEPVPFANVGILHRNIGTVCDENGMFSLPTGTALVTDTFRISSLGYKAIAVRVSDASKFNGNFMLEPQAVALNEITIKPKTIKSIKLGNTADSKSMQAGFASNDLGSELGTVLKYSKKNPGKIKNVHFNISNNTYDSLLFRVNIYSFKKGKTGESLLKEAIYVRTKIKNGTLNLDLDAKEIYITGDALLALEWIKDLGSKGLYFSCGLLNANSYARKASQGDWEKIPVGIGFWAEVAYEK
jgi:hypothetical protein